MTACEDHSGQLSAMEPLALITSTHVYNSAGCVVFPVKPVKKRKPKAGGMPGHEDDDDDDGDGNDHDDDDGDEDMLERDLDDLLDKYLDGDLSDFDDNSDQTGFEDGGGENGDDGKTYKPAKSLKPTWPSASEVELSLIHI